MAKINVNNNKDIYFKIKINETDRRRGGVEIVETGM